jgi:hypothetical protein
MTWLTIGLIGGCGPVGETDFYLDKTVTFSFGWSSCDLGEGIASGGECATVDAPAWYDTFDEVPTIPFTVYRVRDQAGVDAPVAMWMIGGDLGASGESLTALAADLVTRWDGVDFYVPDLRGTGRSAAVTCGLQQSSSSPGGTAITPDEWAPCVTAVQTGYGAELPYFTTEFMAWDVEAAMRSSIAEGADPHVVLYAEGWGALVANRMLDLFPDRPDHPDFVVDRIALDGPISPDRDLADADTEADGVISGLLDACTRDSGCSERLETGARDDVLLALQQIDEGGCASLVADRFEGDALAAADALRGAIYALFSTPRTVPLVPAVAYRLMRCDAGDVAALDVLLDGVADHVVHRLTSARPDAPLEALHVGLGELSPVPPDLSSARTGLDGTIGAAGLSTLVASAYGVWPAAEGAALPVVSAWGGQVLVLAGDLDARQSLGTSAALADRYGGALQHWVPIANATQRTLDGSPVGGGVACGETILQSFATTGIVDAAATACTASVNHPGFEPSIDLGLAAFGAADPWDAPGGTTETTVPLFE